MSRSRYDSFYSPFDPDSEVEPSALDLDRENEQDASDGSDVEVDDDFVVAPPLNLAGERPDPLDRILDAMDEPLDQVLEADEGPEPQVKEGPVPEPLEAEEGPAEEPQPDDHPPQWKFDDFHPRERPRCTRTYFYHSK